MNLKIIRFSAVWCGPCKTLLPIWAKLAKDITDVGFEAVDVDKDPEMAANFRITSIPTMVFIKDGVEVDRVVGLVSEKKIIEKIESLRK